MSLLRVQEQNTIIAELIQNLTMISFKLLIVLSSI